MSHRLPAAVLALAVLAATGSLGLAVYKLHRAAGLEHPVNPPVAAVVETPPTPEPTADPSPTPTPAPTPIPASLIIKVPFTSQAPLGWGSAHPEYEEWCEATAIYMVGLYYKGDTRETVPGAEADRGIRPIVAYERQAFPGVVDLSLDKMSNVGGQVFSLQAAIEPATPDSIRQELADGHPVILPLMTHGLPGGRAISPYYSAGNVYHVVLIKGYDTAKGVFYTNDAGINQGESYPYTWDVLSTAMDAQIAKMGQGRVMLVFKPRAA